MDWTACYQEDVCTNHLIRSEIPIAPTGVGRKGTDGRVYCSKEKRFMRGASLPALPARLCTSTYSLALVEALWRSAPTPLTLPGSTPLSLQTTLRLAYTSLVQSNTGRQDELVLVWGSILLAFFSQLVIAPFVDVYMQIFYSWSTGLMVWTFSLKRALERALLQ